MRVLRMTHPHQGVDRSVAVRRETASPGREAAADGSLQVDNGAPRGTEALRLEEVGRVVLERLAGAVSSEQKELQVCIYTEHGARPLGLKCEVMVLRRVHDDH
jgi:hypothetical protein